MRRLVCKYCHSPMETAERYGRDGLSCLDRCPRCGAVARFEVRGGRLSAAEWVVGIPPGQLIRRDLTVKPWQPEPSGGGKK